MNQYVKSKFNLKVRCLNYHMGRCYLNLDRPKDCRRIDGKPCKDFEEIIVQEDTEIETGQIDLL